MQHTTDIHINHAVPFVYLKFFESRERQHPGVIHDYVDSATSFQTELDKRLDILKGCDVQSPVFSSSAIIFGALLRVFSTALCALPREQRPHLFG